MVKHIFVVTGGRIDPGWLRSILPSFWKEEEENSVIAADRGLLYAKEAGIFVDKVLGDFDSLPEGILEEYRKAGAKIRAYPPEKDYTDTHLALKWALEEGADKVTVFGGLGSRFDHSFANIGLLSFLLENGAKGELVDGNNRIVMMDRQHTGMLRLKEEAGKKQFVSLLPYTQKVTGITLSGFRYPLKDETLTIGESRGISNELAGGEGTIEVGDGILMVVRAWD